MRGLSVIVTPTPRGVQHEGYISGTPKPGQLMQIQAGTAMDGTGRFTWEVYNQNADGDRALVAILLEDAFQGKMYDKAYASGDRARFYIPIAGEEFNVMKGDVAGTADDFAVGDKLMIDDGTGKVIITTGTPESEPFICLEAIVDPVADQLVHCMYTGY